MPETYEFHEGCLVFPEATEECLKGMADDIKARGLDEPIWTHKGKIVDGRNRLKACDLAGIEPKFQEWNGPGSLLDFIWSKNFNRRHMNASQRAMVIQAFKPMLAAETKEETRERQSEAGKRIHRGQPSEKGLGSGIDQDLSSGTTTDDKLAAKAKTSKGYIKDAARITKASPETAAAVIKGEKTIPQAKKELGLSKPKPSTTTNGHAGGQSRVNGQVVADPPDVTRARAKGRIPADVVVEVEEPDEPTSVEAVREDIEEQAAMADDALSDEDWLARLPLSSKLTGTHLKTFQADALIYRNLEKAVKKLGREFAPLFNEARRKGAYTWKVKSFLGTEPPSKWHLCPSPENGGCNGAGQLKGFGNCPKCHGRGYWLMGGRT